MPGDFLRRTPQLTMEQFHAFRDERPKEEKWELIDGVPIMMPPPTLVHQRIADNLNQLLNARLLERINNDGRTYLTQTQHEGRFVIRFQVGQTSTSRDDVQTAWSVIRELARGLE